MKHMGERAMASTIELPPDVEAMPFQHVGRGAWRQRRLADGARGQIKEIRQHLVALVVMGQALKGFDELLAVIGWRRHAWSLLPGSRGVGSTSGPQTSGEVSPALPLEIAGCQSTV